MNTKRLLTRYVLTFLVIGLVYGSIEYLIRIATPAPELFWPLIIRASLISTLLGTSIGVFDMVAKDHFIDPLFDFVVST